MQWLYKFVRRRTNPIPEHTAVKWKRRLSYAYGLIAWNAFGFMIYTIYQGKSDWAHYHGLKTDEEHNMSSGQSWANTLGIKNAKVYRIKGFTKVEEYDIVDGERKDVMVKEKKDEEIIE